MTPKDFCLYPYKRVVFEGSLADFVTARAAETAAKIQEMADGQPLQAQQDGNARNEKDMERRLRRLYDTGASERVVAYGS